MKTKYSDLIDQTFDFPQEDFEVKDGELHFCGIPTAELAKKYGTPLKLTYIPRIGEQVEKGRELFRNAMQASNYEGRYHYCYCTKSSHFSFVLNEAIAHGAHIETSSAYDMAIVKTLLEQGHINKQHYILCNGIKTPEYIAGMAELINDGCENVIPILDNPRELALLDEAITVKCDVGLRIASEESPKFEFYTSRLGIGYKSIEPFYRKQLKDHPKFNLKLLHFFVNTGITDTAYYWNELAKSVRVYRDLARQCPTLSYLDIGGGFPIKSSLTFNYDYEYMASEIVLQIKQMCNEVGVQEPDIFTEFGTYTVGESGAILYSVIDQKPQNDRERWNLIDSSFMTTLPDTWAINRRFIMLPLNRWHEKYERVFLGGLTCDSDDYYNAEQHSNAIYLPEFDKNETQYIGFFYTGAYQDSVGGMGGLKHCLIPHPRHLLIDQNQQGELVVEEYAPAQSAESMLRLLGYMPGYANKPLAAKQVETSQID